MVYIRTLTFLCFNFRISYNICTWYGVIMYSPTISIRITDADTRGRSPEQWQWGRGDQNTHCDKLRQEGR